MLMEEADSMKHCVGGYSLDSNSRFFSISNENIPGRKGRTTLQLKFITEMGISRFKILQHHGFGNTGITNDFKNVAETLLTHLNGLGLDLPEKNKHLTREELIPF